MNELKTTKSISNQESDCDIISIIKNDKNKFSLLYDKYNITLRHFILTKFGYEIDLDDIIIEVFTKIYEKLELYDETKSNFSTWMYNIAYNHTIDYKRKHSNDYCSIEEIQHNLESENSLYEYKKFHVDNTLTTMINDERRKTILSVLNISLDDNYPLMKEVVNMRYFKELSYSEIVTITDLTEANVKTLLHRAKIKMKNYIINNNIDL